MTRPTERPPTGSVALRDADVGDWLDARERAALLFWDEADERCRRLRARLDVVAAAAGIELGILDVRHDALVAQALGVQSVPSLVVFRKGEVVERIHGAPPDDVLRQALG